MANMELDMVDEGVSTLTEPEAVADETQDIAQEDTQQVADDAEPETVSMADFKALQSKYEKRFTTLATENEQLKAQTVTPSDAPLPEEVSRYNDLLSQYQYVNQLADSTEDEDEYAYAVYQQGALRTSLVEAEATLIARKVGIDPNDVVFQQALRQEPIASGQDIERIAWRTKAQSTNEYQVSDDLKQREKKMTKAEKAFDEQVKSEVAKQVAGIRQELGLNATPSTQPTGTPSSRSQLERELAKAKEAGDWNAVLDTKGILSQLTD